MSNNILYFIPGCAFCRESKRAAILANLSLPLDRKISMVDIHRGDSRIALMDKRHPDGRYLMPTMVLDIPKNDKGNFRISRTVLISSSIKELDSQMIKHLNNQPIYRYY